MTRFTSRFRWVYVAPVLAFVALLGWGLASPMGSSPDDDFHLVSIWCASSSPDAHCTAGTDASSRQVPRALLHSTCYLPDPKVSASCQYTTIDFDPTHTELTQRGNFVGGYPPVYYAVMGLFVGPNILASVVIMRAVNALLFVALTTALFAFLPVSRRPVLVLTWLVTTIPLGIFLIPSVNPSSWTILGVGSAWLALLGWFETTGSRRIGLGIVFALATIVAAGSRGDGAIYTSMGIGIVLLLAFTKSRSYLKASILPAAGLVACAYFFISAQQVVSGLNGFGGPAPAGGAPRALPSLLAYNLLNVPTLWAGVFGSWGLGWLEVAMPGLVALGSLACFLVVAAVGFGKLSARKAASLIVLGLALIVIPVFVLTRGGDIVGEQVQPRYILPLVILLAGVLLLPGRRGPVVFSRGQTLLVAGTLAVTQFVALHVTMSRYITGATKQGLDLNQNVGWWWPILVSPMATFVVTSLCFAAVVAILLREVAVGRTAVIAKDLTPTATVEP